MEFSIPVQEVKSWPLRKFVKYSKFLESYYKKKYGEAEDYEQQAMDVPSVPNNPKASVGKAKSLGSKHGASGHTYKFR